MSYTHIDIVRHYLTTCFPTGARIHDQMVVFSSDEPIPFYGGSVVSDAIVVKSLRNTSVDRVSIAIQSGRTALPSSPLVRGSVVVASDSSLGHVYVENLDYVVDYDSGELILKPSGDISIGSTVTVWYQPFTVYANGSDYFADVDRGKLKRLTSGDILLGEAVFIDYQPVYTGYDDEIVEGAVLQANSVTQQEVDPDRQFGADPVLQAAATYRALRIICHASAVRQLSSGQGDSSSASAWIKLAVAFDETAGKLIRAFRPPFEGPSAPTHG